MPFQNKTKEDLNSYDFYLSSSRGNITPRSNYISHSTQQTYNIMTQENVNLKKQLMDLVLENKNLQNKINNNLLSPIILKENNFSNINSINRQSQIFSPFSDKNINIFSKTTNLPSNEKKNFEESVESIIKTNTKLVKKNNNIKNIENELKKKEYLIKKIHI